MNRVIAKVMMSDVFVATHVNVFISAQKPISLKKMIDGSKILEVWDDPMPTEKKRGIIVKALIKAAAGYYIPSSSVRVCRELGFITLMQDRIELTRDGHLYVFEYFTDNSV